MKSTPSTATIVGLSGRTCLAVSALALATTACHVVVGAEDVRRGDTRREPRAEPRALPATLIVADDGRFRLVEPLVCPVDSVTELELSLVRRTQPNLATLVVGVIATTVGGVATAAGWMGDDPSGSPWSYLGPAGVVAGLPLAIGPLIGNDVETRPTGTREVRAPAGDERCGERGVTATRVTLTWSGLRAVTTVDGDGYLAVSPFSLVDAFDRLPALALAIELEGTGAPRALDVVIDAAALARVRDGFLAHAGVDATVEPVRKVPRLEPGLLRVGRVHRDGQRGVRLALPLTNAGPGDAYGVRLVIAASNPELDGRVLYVGRLAAKASIEVVGVIPISAAADLALADGDLTVTARIKDAHGTAPELPVRFRGAALHDPSR